VIKVLADAMTRPTIVCSRAFDTAGVTGDQTGKCSIVQPALRQALQSLSPAELSQGRSRPHRDGFVIEEDAIMIKVRRSPLLGGAVMPPLIGKNPSDSPIELNNARGLPAPRCRK